MLGGGFGACSRWMRGRLGLLENPSAECLDLGFAPRARGGDEAAALGGVGLLVQDGNQQPGRKLVRYQRRTPDGDPEPLDGSVDQHAVQAEARGPREVRCRLVLAGRPVRPVGVPAQVVEQGPAVQLGRAAGLPARRQQGRAAVTCPSKPGPG